VVSSTGVRGVGSSIALGLLAGCLATPPGPGDGGGASDAGDQLDSGGQLDTGSSAGACPALAGQASAAMTDDFNDQEMGPCWRLIADDPGCATTENAAGALVVTMPPDGVGRCGYETTARYDLTSSAALVEVLTTPRLLETYASLEVRRDAQNLVVLRQVQLDMHCYTIIGGSRSDGCLMSHDPTTHRWWRIREEAGTLFWERSSDGVTWYGLGSRSTPFDVSSVVVSLGATSSSAPGLSREARFDRYNLPP
jgi:hypothetical protein